MIVLLAQRWLALSDRSEANLAYFGLLDFLVALDSLFERDSVVSLILPFACKRLKRLLQIYDRRF